MRANFLSGFRLTAADGSEICIRVRKAIALFAYLALEPDHLHSREKIACLLWNSAGDHAARQSLRRCLSDLRRALGPLADRVLIVDHKQIGIVSAEIEVDVLAFRQHLENRDLENAITQLRNADLLEGLEIDSEPFQEWILAERIGHKEAAVEALYVHAKALADNGAFYAAIEAGRRLLAFDPLYEDGHLLLIQLLQKIGRHGAARRQYASCELLLQEGLGVGPARETREAASSPPPNCHVADKPTVVVKRPKFLGNSESEIYLASGLFNDLITELSRHRWVSVIPDGKSGRYVVDSTARLVDRCYKLTIHLLSGIDDRAIWSETFEGSREAIVITQSDLAREVIARFIAEIERNEFRRSMSGEIAESALDYWHRGKVAYFQFSKESNAKARRLLAKSIELDPEFAPAYATMAYAEQGDAFFNYSGSRQLCLSRGLEMARKAITLDPTDASAYQALAAVLLRLHDYDSAMVNAETALSLCPSADGAMYTKGVALFYQGRQTEALEQIDRTMRMVPHSPRAWVMRHLRARCCYDLGRFEEALHWANQAVIAPNAKTIAHAVKAASAKRAGFDDLACRIVKDLLQRDPRMTSNYIFETMGNEFVAGYVEDMASQLRNIGLPS